MTAKTRQAEDPADVEPWVERETGAEPGDLAPDTNAEEKGEDVTYAEAEVVRWKPGRHAFEERVISAADLLRAGVAEEDTKDIIWNHSNGFCVPMDDLDFLTQSQFDAIVGQDHDLEVVTVEV
jgi:hypothetical protein